MMRKVAENRAKMLRCDVRCAKEVALLTQKRMLRLTTRLFAIQFITSFLPISFIPVIPQKPYLRLWKDPLNYAGDIQAANRIKLVL